MMLSKIWHLILLLFLLTTISCEVSGKDLLIGGIGQSKDDQQHIQEFADGIGAEYLPTYLGDWFWVGLPAVEDATPNYLGQLKKDSNSPGGYISTVEFDDFSQQAIKNYNPTLTNGLSDPILNGEDEPIYYDTIYSHSGGTRTAVTALLYQNVKADTLVLISPIQGADFMDLGKYQWELTQLFIQKKVNHIIIYQSSVDNLPWGKGFYQAKFDKDNPGIEGDVTVIELDQYEDLGGKTNWDAHVQMWYTVLEERLGGSPEKSQNLFQKLGTGVKNFIEPIIKPQTVSAYYENSGTSGSSQTGKGTSNSIVGKWTFSWVIPDSPMVDHTSVFDVIFKQDGTIDIPAQNIPYADGSSWPQPALTGSWIQSEDHVIWYIDFPTAHMPLSGSIQGNSMSGLTGSQSWSARRISSAVTGANIAGVGTLIN